MTNIETHFFGFPRARLRRRGRVTRSLLLRHKGTPPNGSLGGGYAPKRPKVNVGALNSLSSGSCIKPTRRSTTESASCVGHRGVPDIRQVQVKQAGGTGWDTIRWKQDLLERTCVAMAVANFRLLDAHTRAP